MVGEQDDAVAQTFFFFGSLRDRDIAAAVLGRPVADSECTPAHLAGYTVVCTDDDLAPVLVLRPSAVADGVVMTVDDPGELARIMFFESVDYSASELQVTLEDGSSRQAVVWCDTHYAPTDDRPWDYEAWLHEHKERFVAMTTAYMDHYATGDVAAAEAGWDAAFARYEAGNAPAS